MERSAPYILAAIKDKEGFFVLLVCLFNLLRLSLESAACAPYTRCRRLFPESVTRGCCYIAAPSPKGRGDGSGQLSLCRIVNFDTSIVESSSV